MKKLLFVLCLIPSLIFGQNTFDVINLVNGNIIKGTIIEKNENTVKIVTLCDNTFVINHAEIAKITQEKDYKFHPLKENGYFNYTSMGALIGSEIDEKTTTFSFLMEHNYQINKNIAVGAVTGIEWFNISVAPLGINVKLFHPQSHQMAYYFGNSAGYSVPLEELVEDGYEIKETKGGYFYNTEFGIVFPSTGNANLYIAIGYRYQQLSYVREDWWLDDVERKTIYNRFSLKIGVCLH